MECTGSHRSGAPLSIWIEAQGAGWCMLAPRGPGKMIGETLDGKYKMLRLLGEGGMGAVYEARHAATRRRVAVKVIREDRSKKGSERVSRFQREAKAAGSIESQHIAQILDAGTDPASGAPYLVMEYLEGEDLNQLLKRVIVLPPRVALRIVAQVCMGLSRAHAARVFHRDIKPHNLFLSRREGREVVVKILDFGIAKMKPEEGIEGEAGSLTRTGSLLGSPLYMSPEQARSRRELDHRTDIWSLGVVLYRALAGRTPHEDAGSLGELIFTLCSAPPPAVQDMAPWVPPEIAAVAHGALQVDPARRFPTAAAMLEAIQPLLPEGHALKEDDLIPLGAAEREVVASKLDVSLDGGAYSPSGAQGASDTAGATGSGSRRAGGGRRWKTVAMIGAGLSVLGVVAFGAISGTSSGPASPEALGGVARTAAKLATSIVAPPTTSAEVDGASAQLMDGGVEDSGARRAGARTPAASIAKPPPLTAPSRRPEPPKPDPLKPNTFE